MSGHMARESSIWNNLFFGKPNVPKDQFESEPEKDYDAKFDERKDDVESLRGHKVRKTRGNLLSYVVLVVVVCFLLGERISLVKELIQQPSVKGPGGYDLSEFRLGIFDDSDAGATRNIIEVSNPDVPKKSYGDAVYSVDLVQHEFGQSWGSPAIVKFTPPELDFNRVVLTLNTTCSGVQYDRLGNIFVDGIQIWRTSTAEPGGRNISSTFKKDVSTYLNLFQKESEVLLQLDNVLNSKLNGTFNVTLSADFYNIAEDSVAFDEYSTGNYSFSSGSIFSTAKPASSVVSLTKVGPKKPSLAYLPSDKIQVELPSVPVNTTRLKLSVFASGNAEEEFWYSNVLDQFVDKFSDHGKKLHGHGPVRILNVFFNGEKIATQAPEPVVFTGGISPALWSPVVSIDAFDLPAVDIDVTGLLPYLWENQAIEDRVLEVEISNGLDETTDPALPKSKISENWITSVNLLTYENEDVVDASGEVLNTESTQNATVFAIAPPFSGLLQQIITTNFSANLSSDLHFLLSNGSFVNVTSLAATRVKGLNLQVYLKFGAAQLLFLLLKNKKSVEFVALGSDGDAPVTVHGYQFNTTYPLSIKLEEKSLTKIPGDINIEYEVKIKDSKKASLLVSNGFSMKNSVKQKGNSTYFISAKGNHGTGSLDTKYKFDITTPLSKSKYSREVQTANGTIISDVEIPATKAKNLDSSKMDVKTSHSSATLRMLDDKEDILESDILDLLYQMQNEVHEGARCHGAMKDHSVKPRYPPMKEKKFRNLLLSNSRSRSH